MREATVRSLSSWIIGALSELKQLTEDEQPSEDATLPLLPLFKLCCTLAREAQVDAAVAVRVAGLDLQVVLVEYTDTIAAFEPQARRYHHINTG